MFIGIRNELRTVGKQIGYQQFPLEHKAAGDERCFISVFFWRLGDLEVIATVTLRAHKRRAWKTSGTRARLRAANEGL